MGISHNRKIHAIRLKLQDTSASDEPLRMGHAVFLTVDHLSPWMIHPIVIACYIKKYGKKGGYDSCIAHIPSARIK
jgi:hypothetical protein